MKEIIKKWLGKNWKQVDGKPCFTSNKLEALYVYENNICYWDDIRSYYYKILPIPKSKRKLKSIIFTSNHRVK